MERTDFDSLKERQLFGAGPYSNRRTNSQSDTVSVQTSNAGRSDGIMRQFSSTQVFESGGGLGSWITDDMKKMFHAVYKKHGSVKERRELNLAYRHILCERCLSGNKICKIQPSAFQCGNCPTYIKCSRVPILNKLRVLHVMNITEEQYDWLLTWYKKTVEEQILKSLKEPTKLTSLSHPHEIENSTNMQFRKIDNEFPDRTTTGSGQENLTYGYSVAQEHPSTSISPTSVDSSASYFENEQLPLNRFLTPIIPYYTPAVPYRCPSRHVPGSIGQYRNPDSFHQQFRESSGCVNPTEYPSNIRSRHDDPRAYSEGSEAAQSSMVYDGRGLYMSNHQICVDEFDRTVYLLRKNAIENGETYSKWNFRVCFAVGFDKLTLEHSTKYKHGLAAVPDFDENKERPIR
ncbi:hypothetical protein F5877DRAFT_68835 [Lentinula edodes]|nr:hypothetical protein F5877DRAFT_68835 [Lentinula edodes]